MRSKSRYLLSNINLINIVLAGALIFFVFYMFLPLSYTADKYAPPVVKKSTVTSPSSVNPSERGEDLFLSDYIIIAEQNLFHPERKIPEGGKGGSSLQKPDFVLYGTLITDDLNIAYMEDRKSPLSTPGRGKRQTTLKLGDSMSGFTLKEVETDKVIMQKDEERLVVYINDPAKPKKREIPREAITAISATKKQQKESTSVKTKSLPHGRTREITPSTPSISKNWKASSQEKKSSSQPKKEYRKDDRTPGGFLYRKLKRRSFPPDKDD